MRVLTGVGIDDEQHFMRCAVHRLADHALHLAQFFHQMKLRRQTAGRVRHHHVDLAGARLRGLHRANAIEDGVTVRSGEGREEGGGLGIGV